MKHLISFFKRLLTAAVRICRLVPMLPIVVFAAIPLALLGDWRPWNSAVAAGVAGRAANGAASIDSNVSSAATTTAGITDGGLRIPVLGDPGVGQWIVIVLVLVIVADTVRGMIDDIRHGQVGVDLLAVMAMLSTVAVHEYWASWAVTLMITSGEAIEEYAQSKAERNLTALMNAAPQTAHVVNLPGVGRRFAADKGDASGGFRRVGLAPAAAAAQHYETVPVGQVQPGDVLMVLPGETVPVDGELLSGEATLDLSAINGEPMPRTLFAGARVMSGAVNGSTALTMRATQPAADSQYQRILQLVESAQESRPAVVKTADRLAVPFTVLALLIAGVAWAVSGVSTRFAQVLVLATPCPLLIAAPVAYIAGTGRLAAAGVLIKTQDVLENLGKVTQVFFDKTGTLTVKQPQVVRVEMLPETGVARPYDGISDSSPASLSAVSSDSVSSDSVSGASTASMPPAGDAVPAERLHLDEDHVLMFAGVVESYSVHILSKGIAKAGAEAMRRLRERYEEGQRLCPEPEASWSGHGRDYPVVKSIKEDSGKGVSGEVNGHAVRVGRLSFAAARDDGVLTANPLSPLRGQLPLQGGTEKALLRADTFTNQLPLQEGGKEGGESLRTRFGRLQPDEMASYVSVDGQLIARIVLRDVPRTNAREALARLHELGVAKLAMLTGDKRASAEIIAREVGIDEVHAELFPEDKVAAVKAATAENDGVKPITMMVGDGVNDAPVLAVADLGVAMTDGTSTAASESAQVVIMNDDIAAVPRAIAIARRTKRIMLQAVIAGLTLAVIGMVAAAFNLIPVVVGAFLQEAIDVVSILWALTAVLDRE
ncbi:MULTISPECIES: HAD-IC family P-type ATPase [unclassified Bifidobacterium]|uniref:HAD-IC family P-type ATPase n=1 Tax=unclassified Bifidobacterium TaxID=2608897 RepID=UPI001D21A3CD|nr:ATPase [Bifidobacterium sp. UTCIF-1]TPF79857.1 ATPase [Bifidobacterium sp. UTCIF-24]TPF82235.1 ATPase [Bifidobacterium sp. UTCIF-3]TPF84890.1 ATPase [Bifidobacterium sp. UTCIF-36]TPF88622.1 ATPase [Bifidobacterium sp. UTBIF-56]